MPCTRDGGLGSYNDLYPHYEPEPDIEDAFCSACTALESAGIEIPPTAKVLWENHKAKDAERIEAERANTERERLKREGLSKLTKAEQDALGLRRE